MKLADLAEKTGCELHGDGDCEVTVVAPLDKATPGSISFLSDQKLRHHLATTQATAVIVRPENLAECPCNALVCANPYATYARIATLLYPEPEVPAGIHPQAIVEEGAFVAPSASIAARVVIEAGAHIGERARIGAGSVVGRDSRIGDDSRIAANVTIYHGVSIGARANIQAGAVIGADGFGFANDAGVWVRIPQVGGVRIGDDVEIGANTTVDRGALEDTVLENGVKLDNQIMVAHNVYIGENSAAAGCVGIAGSARIGRRCTLAGGVGVVGHLEICDDVHVTGMSMVTHSIKQPGVYSSGTPLESNRSWHKNCARFKQLDSMARKLKALEKNLDDQE